MRRPRSRSSADLDAVDVLLVEDDDGDVAADEVRTVLHELALEAMTRRATWPGDPQRLPDADAEPDLGSTPPSLLRRAARRYRRQAVTGAVVATAVVVATVAVDARETAARAAALAAAPAVLTDASSPPGEAWRIPGRVVSDDPAALLVVDGATLQAVDPATGEVTWTASAEAGRAAATGRCFPVGEGLRPEGAPIGDGARPRGLVACVTGAPPGTSGDEPTPRPHVVVMDVITGRTTHTVTADGGLLLVEPVDGDLVVATALPDGRVRATRWDLRTATPRWDSTSPRPVLTDGVAHAAERRPDSLTVGDFAVHLETGEELDAQVERGKPYPYEEHVLPGGARATWAWKEDGTSGRGRVWGGTSGSRYLLAGPPLRPSITDGSDAGVLVIHTRWDWLRGLDLRTGRPRWTQPHPGSSAPRATAVVDGVMLLDDGAALTALDVSTGDSIWRTPMDADATDGAALTDGEVVLLPVRGDDGGLHLVAHRIADGTVSWRGAMPSGTVALSVVDHRLIASTGEEVLGLG